MNDFGRVTWIAQAFGQRGRKFQTAVGLAQQHQSAITGNIPTRKTGLHAPAICDWKLKRVLGTNCHGETSLVDGLDQLRL
jgi:hypothetical protein